MCGGAHTWHGRSESHARYDLRYRDLTSETLTSPVAECRLNITVVGRIVTSNAQYALSLITIRVRNRSRLGSRPMANTTALSPLRLTFHRHRSAMSPPAALLLLRFDRFSQTIAKRIIETPSDSRHSDSSSSTETARIDQNNTSASPSCKCLLIYSPHIYISIDHALP